MSFESSFDRSYEREQRRQNEQKVKQLEAAAAHLTPEITEKRHIEYVKNSEKRFDEESGYHAKGLERLIQYGIAQGRLLDDPENSSYLTEPIWTNRYDDIKNRIDAAATVHAFPESNSAGEEADLTFGIDLTTNPDEETIRKKLLIGTNNRDVNLPVGFSQIEYHRDANGVLSKKDCVPRYCIGINGESVDDYLDSLVIDRSGAPHVPASASLVPSFKILYEMSQQNALFEAPLYQKDDSGTITEEESKALHQMELLDNIYLKELGHLAAKLPPWANGDCLDKTGTYNIEKIAKKFMRGDLKDETFTRIVEITRTLEDEYNNSDNGEGDPDPDYLKKAGDALRRQPNNAQSIGSHITHIAGRMAP